MKSEIIKLRKKIYKNLKAKALSFEAPNIELNEYLQDQIKSSRRKFNLSNMEKLSKQVLDSNIIYIGDFHTFDQNIRNVLRIVKLIVSEKSNCVLGLEMVSQSHQLFIDAYLEHHLTELEFLESINYHDSWRFPWSHYRLIFELAKEYNLKVVGLNTGGSLEERDEYAANLLAQTNLDFPNSSLLVLYGELHITKNKIPLLMNKKCPKLKHTIIHQNLDEVYWKLIKQEREQGIVTFSKNEFCIVSAPPWIKYESMIYWYENLCNDPDFDIHEYIIENGIKIFSDETKESFYHIAQELISHLKIEIENEQIEDFNLYDHTNLIYIEESLEKILKPSLLVFYEYLIATNKSFKFPKGNVFYCSSYSMNRISYLAGIHIYHLFQLNNHCQSLEILNSKNNSNKFILFCFESMYAYFFSKIINPHRKCDMYLDLEERRVDYEVDDLALLVIDSDSISEHMKGKKLSHIYEVSLLVGHILGEYLYITINSEDSHVNIHKILRQGEITHNNFQNIKELLLKNKKYKTHIKRYF